jgi:hypothetical protein
MGVTRCSFQLILIPTNFIFKLFSNENISNKTKTKNFSRIQNISYDKIIHEFCVEEAFSFFFDVELDFD